MRRRQRNIFHKVLNILAAFVFLLPGLSTTSGYAQGLETLAGRVSNSIIDYFTAKGESDIRFSITKFENFSGITDLAAHKFYQQLAARLEGRPQAAFSDLMIDFSQKKGEFNLNRIDQLDYLIYLKLIKKLDKVGAGIAIFSRSLDKIVYIKYFEEDFSPSETNIYETVDYGFKGLGFSRQIEIGAEKNLLDFKSITNPSGEPGDLYLFFYPGVIEIFKTHDNQFKKILSFKLEWGRPYYPVMDYEGRLCLFYRAGEDGGPVIYLTAGSNFSPRSKVLSYQNNQWQEIGVLDFVPIKAIRLNNSDYLAGAIYDEGKNFFKDKLILVPFSAAKLDTQNLLEKKVVPFFTVDFSIPSQQRQDAAGENVDGVHLIDNDYNYRFYAGDIQERGASLERRGSAIAALDGQWLALSDYSISTQKDKLYFYKIEAGSKQAVYENSINGQVHFISAGSWQDHTGFWVYVEEMKNDSPVYRLQFWSKNIEKEGNN